ncbi:MAG: hypothetical protein WC405_09090 [Syntrophales bacterium]
MINRGTIKLILKALEIIASVFVIFKTDNGGKKNGNRRSAEKK